MGTLEGKIVLVTGAGRGLGRACALVFAREGAKIVIADLDSGTGAESVELVRQAGSDAVFVRADVSREDDVRAMVQVAVDHFGGLDCAVNNAMRGHRRLPLADMTLEDWHATMDVNFTGVFLCMKYEIPAMIARGGGAIVNIGSGTETTAVSGLSWYLAAKQGVYGLTKVAALDYASQGIRVNAVAPGPMWTPALRETAAKSEHHIEDHIAHVPMGRIGEPEEVAEAALWLCSPRASYVTGVRLSADGGYVLG